MAGSVTSSSFVASLTNPTSVREELERSLELEADLDEHIPRIIREAYRGAAPGRDAGAGAGAGSGRDFAGSALCGATAELVGLLPDVKGLERQTRQMAVDLSSTSRDAESAVSRVKELDQVMGRAQMALERVEDILDLRQCLGSVQQCLDSGDLLGAASTVKRFKAVERVVPVSDDDRRVMRRAEEDLLRIVTSRFDSAVVDANSAEVTRCCQLMSVLGNSSQGLERYAAYVNDYLDKFAVQERERYSSDDGRGESVNLLSSLFNKGATLLKQSEVLADKFMTDDAQARVLIAVHAKVDSLAAEAIQQLLAHPRVAAALRDREAWLREVEDHLRATPRPGPGAEASAPTLSAAARDEARMEADALLTELAIICQRCVSYDRLMCGKAQHIDAVAAASASREAALPRRPSSLSYTSADGDLLDAGGRSARPSALDQLQRKNKLAQGVGELSGVYSMLEEAFMATTVWQAIESDEIAEDGRTSLVSEDAFYIMQKCARRAINTGNSDCACSVVNHACAILARQVMGELSARITFCGRGGASAVSGEQAARFSALQATLQEAVAALREDGSATGSTGLDAGLDTPAGAPPAATSASDTSAPKAKAITQEAAFWSHTLNNLLLCMQNTERLRQSLDRELQGVFNDELTQAKLRSCLSELDGLAADFRKALQTHLSRLCASQTPRLRGVMTPMEGTAPIIHYEITDDEYAKMETYDVFTTEVLAGLRRIINPFQVVLYDQLYRRMVLKVAAYMAKQIEASLRRRKFNHLGGLQLDRNVRALVSLFQSESNGDRGVRERMARLVEVSRLMSCDSLEEVRDYSGMYADGLVSLTPDDARQFLSLRVDFDQDAIADMPF